MAIRKPIVSKSNKHSPLSVGDNLDLGGTKLTGLANATLPTDAVAFGQLSGLGKLKGFNYYANATYPAQTIPALSSGSFLKLSGGNVGVISPLNKTFVYCNVFFEIDVTNLNGSGYPSLYLSLFNDVTGVRISSLGEIHPVISISERYSTSSGKDICVFKVYGAGSNQINYIGGTDVCLGLEASSPAIFNSSFKIGGAFTLLEIS